jgi:heme A synthase
VGAFLVLLGLIGLNFYGWRYYRDVSAVAQSLSWLNGLVLIQILLGILTVLTIKEPYTTSIHVVTGAALLGFNFLFLLRVSPLKWDQFVRCVQNEKLS